MNKETLIAFLQRMAENTSPEDAHWKADKALLRYINDPEITAAWDAIPKWWS